MHVLKFGGTSMDDEHTWRQVLDIISDYNQPFVIVSATARTTRQLLKAAHTALEDLNKAKGHAAGIHDRHRNLITGFLSQSEKDNTEIQKNCAQWIETQCSELEGFLEQVHAEQHLSLRTKDAVASIGERLSSYLFAQCGRAYGLSTRWVDAADIIRTDSDFGKAEPKTPFINKKASQTVQKSPANTISVMGGYYGQDEYENITTLGFEGSDYSASLIGAALNAEAIEIWTDVSGIYTCDPRVVSNARPISELSFQEATELAYFGAKVLHPSTTKPASQQNIPILVKNIFDPDHPGTKITTEASANGRAKAMTFKKEALILTVTSANTVMGYEFLSTIFQALEKRHLPVDVVTTTEASVSIAVERTELINGLTDELQPLGQVEIHSRQGIISLVGCNTDQTQALIRDVLEGIGKERVNLISFSQSKQNLNVVLSQQLITESVKAIHRRIFE